MSEESVMYIVVNDDLKMSKGKLAAQAAHSACKLIQSMENSKNSMHPPRQQLIWYTEWTKGSYVKIVVKAPESFLKKLIADYPPITDEYKGLPEHQMFWTAHTCDEGRTQLEPGSLTTLVFNPAPKSKLPKELLELKLL